MAPPRPFRPFPTTLTTFPPPVGLSPMFDEWVRATAEANSLQENTVRGGQAARAYARRLGILHEQP